ncbi:hypothetical protein ACTIVE_8936 [Actinomadura verrucosospora]|uniref:Uncharacterized protein n=1 Tax=Actinomadura verrucosospora TaxID=46165 RepID=A0A7D3ZR97_ACTVE|nr:hypothetical protein ACTIVE_8936 [Actinomadura verrucosospora]
MPSIFAASACKGGGRCWRCCEGSGEHVIRRADQAPSTSERKVTPPSDRATAQRGFSFRCSSTPISRDRLQNLVFVHADGALADESGLVSGWVLMREARMLAVPLGHSFARQESRSRGAVPEKEPHPRRFADQTAVRGRDRTGAPLRSCEWVRSGRGVLHRGVGVRESVS